MNTLRSLHAEVVSLRCLRHMFVRPLLKMDQRAWPECRVAAFGSSAVSRPAWCRTTLKSGVDKPDLYDSKINRSYAETTAWRCGRWSTPAASSNASRLSLAVLSLYR